MELMEFLFSPDAQSAIRLSHCLILPKSRSFSTAAAAGTVDIFVETGLGYVNTNGYSAISHE
jgi:hypothetical protein